MTGTSERVEAVRVAREHLPALAEFYRQVWDPQATPQSVEASRARAAAQNQAAPGEPPPTWIVLRGERAIAHVTTIPLLLWVNGAEQPAYWLKGLWVLPEFQRSSAGFLVLRAALEMQAPYLSLLHETAAIKLMEALGFTNAGALPNALRLLRPRSLLSNLDLDALGLAGTPGWVRLGARAVRSVAPLVGTMVGAANATWAAIATGAIGDFQVEVTAACDRSGVDALWRSARAELNACSARGGAQLANRYEGGEYAFVQVRSASRLVGVGVVKHPRELGDARLRGVRLATLSDLLFQPSAPRDGLAVLRGAEGAARALGADALMCSLSDARLETLLRRRGYVSAPPNLRVLLRFPSGETPPMAISDWWITRGDSQADESF